MDQTFFVLSRVVCVPSSLLLVCKTKQLNALLSLFFPYCLYHINFLEFWHRRKDGNEINIFDLHR